MSKSTEPLQAIDRDPLGCVTGGQYTNTYDDLSGLVPHDGEKPHMTPEQRINRFLYGGSMAKGDRTALIKNWEESNGKTAPTRIKGTPERDW
jgi:hypothetical protein